MGRRIDLVVDAADPHELAAWWATALEWQVEPTDSAMIEDLVAKGFAKESDTRVFGGALVWRMGAAIIDPDNPHAPRTLFQVAPEGKTVKNRLHLDIRVGPDDRRRVADELIAMGATFLWDGKLGPSEWITLADPAGNEFCVT